MTKKQESTTCNLGELPPELQVGATDNVVPQDIQPTLADELDNDEQATYEEAPEFVVVRGRTVRHDGADYPENALIDVSGDDAKRLLQLGVIVQLDDLREQLLSGNP
ncbi:hypothetical protein ABLA30_17390 [Xenorhabdus nematophila]|uniref:hypothetical protein n=1 Tax=Xenorhabdus nematophila TaxID=628 RepID=UPI0032B80636